MLSLFQYSQHIVLVLVPGFEVIVDRDIEGPKCDFSSNALGNFCHKGHAVKVSEHRRSKIELTHKPE